jgi:nucleotide sugar dehydrogenase
MDVSVVGIGKLGLCFALYLERKGMNVIGVDINKDYVEKLQTKTFKSDEPYISEYLLNTKKFKATTDLKYAVNNSKFIFVLVQTPETDKSYDHSILENTLKDICKLSNDKKHIIVNSTVMPGFFRSMNIYPHTLSYNPAFVAQGNILEDYENGGKFGVAVLGTYEDEVIEFMHKYVSKDVQIVTPESAEVFKIADNTFRVLKITYANLIGDISNKTPGCNLNEVSNLLKLDKSIGSICMTPGYGYGGPCYPRDLKALTTYTSELGLDASVLEGVHKTNEDHHNVLLKSLLEKDLETYTFDSLVYRPGMKVNMTDNSPIKRLVDDLVLLGKNVVISKCE